MIQRLTDWLEIASENPHFNIQVIIDCAVDEIEFEELNDRKVG